MSSPIPSQQTARLPRQLSSKITELHLSRLAIVYVRQSSAKQVEENIESTQLQYQLVDRAESLGWLRSRVDVIDDDLGVSGRSIEGRTGFQRLLAQISLEHVGIVMGIEMSRLARSCRDWHHLLELCSMFDTLIGDADGVYDPRDHNDRLLLGLKGTMSEAELHVLRGRLRSGKLNKARRGELVINAPIGYVRQNDLLVKEHDTQARELVDLLFCKFSELQSASALLRYLREQQIRIGVREQCRPNKGLLHWVCPNISTLLQILHHPIYAGAYTYGRRTTNPKKAVPGRPGKGRQSRTQDQWIVLIKDKFEAYISWEQWEKNQQILAKNSRFHGPARGVSLLASRVYCGICGHKMSVSYSGRTKARFNCSFEREQWGGSRCQSFAIKPLDELVQRQLLLAIEPASIELSIEAAKLLQMDRHRSERHHQQTLDRTIHESEVSRKRYESVDPSNRLVAADLERRWNEALTKQQLAKESLEAFRQKQPTSITANQEQMVRNLSLSIPSLWSAPGTTGVERQQIARALIEKVVVEPSRNGERLQIQIRWSGGYESCHEIDKAVFSFDRLEDSQAILSRVLELCHRGYNQTAIAQTLNEEGYRSTRGGVYTKPIITQLLRRLRKSEHDTSMQSENYWKLKALAKRLNMNKATLNTWRNRGWVFAIAQGNHWLLWADKEELFRLENLVAFRRTRFCNTPKELTTPRVPPAE
jgi:DNA invertase Pin-like site-specific DNA recombinase